MKKIIFYSIAFLAAIACQKAQITSSEVETTGKLNLSVNVESETKAALYTEMKDYEKAVNRLQIFVFDNTGKLNMYQDADPTKTSFNIVVSTGSKTVYAVVNGSDLSSVTTLSALKARTAALSANSTTATTGFVMSGSATCTVSTSSTATAAITVSRLVSRVALVSVTNNLPDAYGSITISNAMLINVPGIQNLECTLSPGTWLNPMGRVSGTSNIINGSTYVADCPALTFNSISKSVALGSSLSLTEPYLFYSYPNNTTTDVTGYVTSFSAAKTRLIVTAVIGGSTYYYPVTLDKLERNKAYSVGLTISGLGSTEPNTPVSKASLTVSITVNTWQNGEVYDAEI